MAMPRWRSQRIRRWLNRRIPPASALALSHRNVFILPSRAGWVYLLLIVVMLLTAINYQNSMIYALTFWLVSMGLAAMWLTFRNLAGLHLSAGHALPVFVGEVVRLPVRFQVSGRWAAGIEAGFRGDLFQVLSVAPGESLSVDLPLTTRRRGRLPSRRIRIQTRYPFGLFTAWSWVALEYPVVIYPQREDSAIVLGAGDGDEEGALPLAEKGDQDFAGIRDYRPGDNVHRIAWKHSARSETLRLLEMEKERGALCWLNWSSLPGLAVENRISRLTSWVCQAQQRGWRYGLELPGVSIAPSSGEHHYAQCLRALALWEPLP